jgi:hypothetical protein
MQPRFDCPGIARFDFYVDYAIVVGDRANVDGVDEAVGAQHPLRFLDFLDGQGFAAFEQKGPLDNLRAGPDVQLVGKPEQKVVFIRIVEIEYVGIDDAHSPITAPAACSSAKEGSGGWSMVSSAMACRHRQEAAAHCPAIAMNIYPWQRASIPCALAWRRKWP